MVLTLLLVASLGCLGKRPVTSNLVIIVFVLLPGHARFILHGGLLSDLNLMNWDLCCAQTVWRSSPVRRCNLAHLAATWLAGCAEEGQAFVLQVQKFTLEAWSPVFIYYCVFYVRGYLYPYFANESVMSGGGRKSVRMSHDRFFKGFRSDAALANPLTVKCRFLKPSLWIVFGA